MKGHKKFSNLSSEIERAILENQESLSVKEIADSKKRIVSLLKELAKHCITMTQ